MTSAKDKKKKKKAKIIRTTPIIFMIYLILNWQLFRRHFLKNQVSQCLMNKLKVEKSSRCIKPDATVIESGGMLHNIHWPSNGIVSDLVDGI